MLANDWAAFGAMSASTIDKERLSVANQNQSLQKFGVCSQSSQNRTWCYVILMNDTFTSLLQVARKKKPSLKDLMKLKPDLVGVPFFSFFMVRQLSLFHLQLIFFTTFIGKFLCRHLFSPEPQSKLLDNLSKQSQGFASLKMMCCIAVTGGGRETPFSNT